MRLHSVRARSYAHSHTQHTHTHSDTKFSRHLIVRLRRAWAHNGHVSAFVRALLQRLEAKRAAEAASCAGQADGGADGSVGEAGVAAAAGGGGADLQQGAAEEAAGGSVGGAGGGAPRTGVQGAAVALQQCGAVMEVLQGSGEAGCAVLQGVGGAEEEEGQQQGPGAGWGSCQGSVEQVQEGRAAGGTHPDRLRDTGQCSEERPVAVEGALLERGRESGGRAEQGGEGACSVAPGVGRGAESTAGLGSRRCGSAASSAGRGGAQYYRDFWVRKEAGSGGACSAAPLQETLFIDTAVYTRNR